MSRATLSQASSAFAIIAAFALPGASASANTIEVPQERNTIQKAVDAADPGDTVLVNDKRNRYYENVVVTTNNLRIVGRSVPIVDGTSRDGSTHGNHFDITADRVSVSGFKLLHGTGVDCTGDGCSFTRSKVHMSDHGGDCVEIDGSNAEVENNRFIGCDTNAINVDGNAARIADNYIRQIDSDCVVVLGNRARITDNRAQNCEDGEGYAVDGDFTELRSNFAKSTDGNSFETFGVRALVVGNRALNADADDCYDLNGARLRVRGNRASSCDGGFEVSGKNMNVIGNRGTLLGDDDGFDIDCFNECQDAAVEDNYASDNNNDDEGYDISSSGEGGMLIKDNTSYRNMDGGFNLSVTNARIIGNLSQADGSEGNESGFEVFGNGRNLLQGNTAVVSGEHGFEINSNGNELRKNVAWLANVDGIYTSGNRTKLINNRAFRNRGDGIENDGTDAVIVRNVAYRNRRDCANDGTIERKRDNFCADGSNFQKPGTVDRHRRR